MFFVKTNFNDSKLFDAKIDYLLNEKFTVNISKSLIENTFLILSISLVQKEITETNIISYINN